MVTITMLIDKILENIDKIDTHGVQSMAYVVKCYQDLLLVKEGVEKMEKELSRLRGEGNDVKE